MNTMSINNTMFTAKMPTRINIKTKNPAMQKNAEDYFCSLIDLRKERANKLVNMLDYLNKSVNLYFRGNEVNVGKKTNAVYINADGPKTSRFDFEQAKDGENLLDAIIKNINLNV